MKTNKHTSILAGAVGWFWAFLPLPSQAANLYVSYFNAQIGRISPNGGYSVTSHGSVGLHNANGLAFDSQGNLYVANDSNVFGSNIVKFGQDGSHSIFASVGVDHPNGIAFDRLENLFVANDGNNTIQKFSPNGAGSVFAHTTQNPGGLVVDSGGNLYVSFLSSGSSPTGSIDKYAPDGSRTVFATGLDRSWQLAVDSADNIYAANNFGAETQWGTYAVVKFSPSGSSTVIANNSSGLTAPFGLTLDHLDNLYVANSDGKIFEFSPGGISSVFADTGAFNPQYLAFGPGVVPEPSTMIYAAIAAIASTSRRMRATHRKCECVARSLGSASGSNVK